jgi:MFS family permease
MSVDPPIPSDGEPAAGQAIAAEEEAIRQRVLRNPGVRALVMSRFASVLGITTLSYGAMIHLAAVGAPQIAISTLGATSYVAALAFGIGGGALSEAMSKRRAMVTAYALQSAACFIVPTIWGPSVPALLVLIFLIAALGQIVTPAVKAATALVATTSQVAVVAAIISVAGGVGAAVGTAFLAPFLVNAGSLQVVAYVSGSVLALGAVRAWWLPPEAQSASLRQGVRQVDWVASAPTLRRTAAWVSENRQVGAMILVGSMVVALFDGLNTLIPVYLRDVLHTSPTNAAFILAPGGVGFFLGTVLGPWWMNRRGERAVGVMALAILGLGFALFGMIDVVTPFLAPISPLRVLERFGFEVTPPIAAAGLISILTAFGSTGAGAAVQTYVNRYVLLARQATTFGMQEVLDNTLTLFAILTFGGLATTFGPRVVFLIAPPLLVLVVVELIRIGFRITAQDTPQTRVILHALLTTATRSEPGK